MKGILKHIFATGALVCAVSGVTLTNTPSAAAESPQTSYKLAVGDYTYGVYTPDISGNTSVWWGAPNNTNAYVNTDNIVAPGADYATAIAFTAPTDGKISPAWGLGAIHRIGEVTQTSDGVRFSVFLNDTKIYPTDKLWADVPQAVDSDGDGNNDNTLEFSYDELTLEAGDKLYYIVDCGGNGNSEWDMCYMLMGFRWESEEYPSGVWYDSNASYWTSAESGEQACPNFTKYKKSQLASYHYVTIKEVAENEVLETENKKVSITAQDFEFTEINDTPLWSGVPISEGRGYCYINGNLFVPGDDYAAAVCFTAPCDGRIGNSVGCGSIFRSGEITERSDGCRLSVVLNDTVLYPYAGVWAEIPQGLENQQEIVFNSVDVRAGDTLYYIVDCGGNDNSEWDINQLDAGFLWTDENNPNGIYVDFSENYWTDESSGNESVSFGIAKKSEVFSYRYVVVDEHDTVGEAEELTYRALSEELSTEKLTYSQTQKRYYKLDDPNLFVYPDFCDPGDYYSLGIVWTAPENGRVDVSKTRIRNFYYQSEPNADGIRSDGVRVKVLFDNEKEIYPTNGEWLIINNSDAYGIEMKPFAVKKGDKLTFILDNNGSCNYDLCKFDITVAFARDGEACTATYNNITDFSRESENASAWSYVAINTNVSTGQEQEEITALPVINYYASGCASSVSGGLSITLVLLTATGIKLSLTAKKKKDEEERE